MESRTPHNKKRQFRHRKGGRGRGFSRGGRGYSRGRSRPYHRKVKSDHELVKSLQNVLRNEAIRFSLQVNYEGKVALLDLRRIPIFSEFDLTEDKIRQIVSNDSEQIFSIKQHKERGLLIGIKDTSTITYTYQKHEKMPLERFDKSWTLCHGTYFQNLKYILSEGLSCMHREFIHLSRTDSITGEKNGLRNDYDCLIYINIQTAINDGIVFYLTPDNVILTTGVEGFLTREYFHKIVGFSKSGPLHRNVLWVNKNPDILHLHEQEILIDDIPNRTFVDLINICRDGFRCERSPGDCPFFHPQPKICEYFMRNWNCFIKGCKHKHLEHCFREDVEKTDEQVRNLDDMRKQKREARLIYMENKRKMIELQNGESSYHGHNGKSSNSRDRSGRFQKPSNGSHSYQEKRRNYKQQHNSHNSSAPSSHQKRDANFEHTQKQPKRTSTNESERSSSERTQHHPPRQNRKNYRPPHSPPRQTTQQPARTQNNVIITQNVKAPVMVVGQIVNNHNGGMNPPVVLADPSNIGWNPSKQPQFPPQIAKSPVPQNARIHPGLTINPQLPRTHQVMNQGYVAYSPLNTINTQFVVLPSALPSYSSPVPNFSPSMPRYSSPVPVQQNFQYFPSYPNPAFAAPQIQPQGFPQAMNPVYVEEHLASKNQYQSRVKPYVVPRNQTGV